MGLQWELSPGLHTGSVPFGFPPGLCTAASGLHTWEVNLTRSHENRAVCWSIWCKWGKVCSETHGWGAKTPRCFPSSRSWMLTVRNNCTDVVSRIFHTRMIPKPEMGGLYRATATLRSANRGGSIPQCHCEVPFFTVDGSLQGALRVLNCWVSNVLRRNDRVFPLFCQQLVGILAHRGMGKSQVQNIGSKPDRSWAGVRMKRSQTLRLSFQRCDVVHAVFPETSLVPSHFAFQWGRFPGRYVPGMSQE